MVHKIKRAVLLLVQKKKARRRRAQPHRVLQQGGIQAGRIYN